ncbi:MAG: hypothetical protein PVF58_21630 [Candidatus Methanofastidiosia archaeon]|jgi:hypothetical protein
MNKGKPTLVVTSVVIISLVVSCVTAGFDASNTLLYNLRMEQASSKMSFLPTEINEFVYNTERGCALNYDFMGYNGISGHSNNANPLNTAPNGDTCEGTCVDPTCPDTCYQTCPGSGSTCSDTCPNSGSTCYWIGSCLILCGYYPTDGDLCWMTLEATCDYSCNETC